MTPDKVRGHELPGLLDAHAPGAKVLSLDCFDTILWRRTATPSDVFFDLANEPAFQALGLSARLRAQAESLARSFRRLHGARPEVRLAEIFRAGFPELPDDRIEELEETELAAEMRACFAFPPIVELMRDARARGLKVVIVSDTYLDEPQLRRLLASAVPDDVMASIDRIFVSSEHRQGKSEGLFEKVIAELRVQPADIFHIGDNPHADLVAARAAGVRAIQLVHHEAEVMELLRLQGTAAALLDPALRHKASVPSPYHAVLAQRPGLEQSEAELLGYAAVGPVLYSFGRFILDEIAALGANGKKVKPLFLMRDAYLPREVCGAIAGAPVGHPVSISRFAAYAASFRSPEDIERYLCRFAGSKRWEDLVRQLLLPPAMARKIVEACKQKRHGALEEFLRRVRRPDVLATIIERSRAYCARMRRYVENIVPVEPGDTLLFVDLGYEGTAQKLLEPVLAAEWGVEVVGRYLIVVSTPGWERSRRGLIDPANTDERASLALVDQIALLEDVCTADMDSVVDYEEDGRPIWGPRAIEREQVERVKPVQQACVDFAADAERLFRQAGHPDAAMLRRAALGQLGRLSYFPTEHEIRYLEGFHLDMNMATSDAFRLFDRDKGIAGLRKRGLFFMEQNLKAKRMNYPMELRYAGLELAVTYLAQQRYQLGFVHADFALRREPVPFILHRGDMATDGTQEARATHDGYYALTIPVGDGDMSAMVLFGQRYAWMQIESIELIAMHALYQDHESHCTEDVRRTAILDGMVERGPGLYECTSPAAFLYVPARNQGGRMACRIVFRPVAWREAAAEPLLAAGG